MNLNGKVALITGSSRGIGAAIATVFAAHGARVVVTYNQGKQQAEAVNTRIGDSRGVSFVQHLDVAKRESVRDCVREVISRWGTVDILINNAAILQQKDFLQITDDEWEQVLNVNLQGPFRCTQEVLPYMIEKKSGKIINIASIGGQWGGQLAVHYAASKAALINFTQSMAKLYSSYNIQTNCISPGLIATEMSAAELETEAGKEKVRNIPAQRLGTVRDVADAALFLASDRSDYLTGQTINLNGGMFFRS